MLALGDNRRRFLLGESPEAKRIPSTELLDFALLWVSEMVMTEASAPTVWLFVSEFNSRLLFIERGGWTLEASDSLGESVMSNSSGL